MTFVFAIGADQLTETIPTEIGQLSSLIYLVLCEFKNVLLTVAL
jgi:hypothetical protein